jgi:uncharacterized membrane protein/subtilisin family serine protease
MSSKLLKIVSVLVLLSMLVVPVSAKPITAAPAQETASANGPVKGASETGLYIVRLNDPSLAAYRGGIAGLAPTSPQVTGTRKVDMTSPASVMYTSYLTGKQAEFITSMDTALGRNVEVAFQYMNVLNALAVQVSPEEAAILSSIGGVQAIYPDTIRQLETDEGPLLIGAPEIWNGNTSSGAAFQGEGVIIGMIDSGINHAHPSFADIGGDGYDHTNPYGSGNYVGWCVANPSFCNDKLIGAYGLYPLGGDPEDTNGHGSHTASTAGGNRHVAAVTVGTDVFDFTIQGVAPHANLIAYEVCNPGCPGTASIAAVDLAVGDGVDVLNYSISGSDDPWNDPVDLAFLDAYAAGIFVSASAGNAGPGASTVAKTGPWNAAVAASTHQRVAANSLDVTAPTPVPPQLLNLAAVPGDGVVLASDIPGEIIYDPNNLNGCVAFPAGFFTGKIALIQRGGCNFSVKIANAGTAGAIAVVVFNSVGGPPSTMGSIPTTPPSVMVNLGDGQAVKDYIDASAPDPVSVSINAGGIVIYNPDWQDIMGGFSSRGPSQFELVKPDYTAPGVNILAAVAAAGGDPVQYGFYQGTSMSSPHGAGSAALLIGLNPTWSPAEVKSALALTADPSVVRDSDGFSPADPFDMGSGRLALGGAGTVGLVQDETYEDYVTANPDLGGDPKSLNQPSMANYNCVGMCSWTRTVKSVLDVEATYTATFTSTMGIVGSVTPSVFTILPGGTQELVITADVTGAPIGSWAFGNVLLATNTVWPVVEGPNAVVLSEGFNDATFPPAGWSVVDNEGTGLEWGNLAACGEAGNYTGGSGDVACASSDWFGLAEFNTELWTPSFSLEGYTSAQVTYLANYQNYGFLDFLDLDISSDGGTTWSNLLSWNEDHGTFRGTPGESVDVDLSAYAGMSNLILRWHYYDPNSLDYDWYAQVDDVVISGFTGGGIPVAAQHMPVVVNPADVLLPDLVTINTTQRAGSQAVSGLQVAQEITDLTVGVDGLAAATLTSEEIMQDPTNADPYDGAGGTIVQILDVPEGALRLVAQIVYSEAPDVDMFVGTGDTPSAGTVVCSSASGVWWEYCNLDNPTPGTYWVLAQSWQGSLDQPDLITLSTGVVTPGDAGNFTVTGPSSVPAGELFDLSANWNIPGLQDGDHYYGVFNLGTDPGNPGNIGSVKVDFGYTQPVFISKTGPATANTNDVIPYTIVMDGNGNPLDGMALMTDTLPTGVEFAGNLTTTYGTATFDEGTNSVYWNNGVLPLSKGVSKLDAPAAKHPIALRLDSTPAGQATASAPLAPESAVALVLDDGSNENNIGIGGGWEFVFANRFTPDPSEFAFDLNQVQVYFEGGTTFVQAGDPIKIVVYENTSGNTDPAVGSNFLASFDSTVLGVDSWNVYDLPTPVSFNGPGDVIIGVIAMQTGTVPNYFPAALDSTAPQQRSWAGWWLDSPPPTPPVLPPDDTWTLIDAFLPGNWLIRGSGETTAPPIPTEITVTFNVTVTAAPGDDVTNTADLVYNGDAFSAETSLHVPGANVELSPAAAALNGAPGETVEYTLMVTNTGDLTGTFDITVTSGWVADLPVTELTLAAGESADFVADVTIPADAAKGDSDVATVTVKVEGVPSAMAESKLTTTANQAYGVTLTPVTDEKSGDPGTIVAYTLQLKNTGNFTDVFSVDASSVWETLLSGDEFTLPAGGTADVLVEVTVPSDAMADDFDVATITATSSDGVTTASSELTTTANQVYGVTLTPVTDAKSGEPGTIVAYTLQLKNTGNFTDVFSVDASSVWETLLSGDEFTLPAGGTANVLVEVTVPSDAMADEFDVATITATSSDGETSASSELTTTAVVVPPTSYTIYLPLVFKAGQ